MEVPSHTIDLGLGQPSPSLLPTVELVESFRSYIKRNTKESWQWLQYGMQQGSLKFRSSLAQFLNDNHYAGRDNQVSPDNLFLTGGASSALQLVCSLFTLHKVFCTMFLNDQPTFF